MIARVPDRASFWGKLPFIFKRHQHNINLANKKITNLDFKPKKKNVDLGVQRDNTLHRGLYLIWTGFASFALGIFVTATLFGFLLLRFLFLWFWWFGTAATATCALL